VNPVVVVIVRGIADEPPQMWFVQRDDMVDMFLVNNSNTPGHRRLFPPPLGKNSEC
jgi:hypothetical protein